MLDAAIIGAGLSGLSLACRMQQAERNFAVFESRDRFGGRIFCVPGGNRGLESSHCYDLGPSWIWPDFQPRVAKFIAQNGIEIFPQWNSGKSLYQTHREEPPQSYIDHSTYEPARRIQGGAYRLVEALLGQLPEERLKLSHQLQEVIDHKDYVEMRFMAGTSSLSITAKQIVITIPPRLLVNTVSFTPGLDGRLRELMNNTATWMAGHAKAVIRYSQAFWRQADYSGGVLAAYQGAALAEIFDACSPGGEHGALSGFFALPAALRAKYRDDLNALIIEQLVRLFGKEAANPEEIIIKDWFAEPLTATGSDETPPATHPQYGHAWLQLDHWNDKLYFSGTETAVQFGGYLEGAFESAERVANSLLV